MANIAVDPYYYSSRMRELSGQKELTTGRGLTQPELEAILNAELYARYTAEQGRRQQKMQERALDIQEQSAEDQAEAAKLSGYAQLGVAGAYVGSKVPAIADYGKKAVNWVTGATPAVTATEITAGGVALTGAAGYAGGKAGEYIVKQTPIEEITPWGGKKTESVMGGIGGGAAAGAVAGSIIPGVGNVVGAVIGEIG